MTLTSDPSGRILEALGFDLRRHSVRSAVIRLEPASIPVLEAVIEITGTDGRPLISEDDEIVTELRRYELVELPKEAG